MRTFKIQTYRLDELEGQALGRALAWLDERPIETENDKGEITFEYLSDDWNDGYKDGVLEHCEINDYLFAYDGTPVHRFIKENHRSENTKKSNNKLIAEFMELEVEDGLYYYTTLMDDYKTDMLYFDSSWDWLMPVAEKIYDEGSFDNELVLLIRDSVAELNLKNTYDSIINYLVFRDQRYKKG